MDGDEWAIVDYWLASHVPRLSSGCRGCRTSLGAVLRVIG